MEDVCPRCGGEVGFSTVLKPDDAKKITYFCRNPECDWYEDKYEDDGEKE